MAIFAVSFLSQLAMGKSVPRDDKGEGKNGEKRLIGLLTGLTEYVSIEESAVYPLGT
jgi:hypothetical protein